MRSHYTLTLSYKYCNSAHATILQYYPLANLAFLSFLAAAVLPSSLPQQLHSQLRTVRTGIIKLATVTIEPNVVWNCLAGVLRSQPEPLGCTCQMHLTSLGYVIHLCFHTRCTLWGYQEQLCSGHWDRVRWSSRGARTNAPRNFSFGEARKLHDSTDCHLHRTLNRLLLPYCISSA
jgi:hypothetical protein